ncbi:M56 family metallopeptidase [uncultured Aquimarina sp.]|uniref:M56 family metallopeptidase n=1 Tax=uncultured Aquimarina sp. TaxID=575652 RepID=UPI00262555DA|nr:M56 family metallopeptidase [uncultured Aquimarina sp.]
MFHYLLQVLIFQLLFLLIYDVLHKKDTFFNWNRLYLLVVPFLSLILPFIEIDLLSSSSAEMYVSNIERTIIASTENIIFNVNQTEASSKTSSRPINWWAVIYIAGIAISLIHLILKFHKLHILRNVSNISKAFNKRIVILPNSSHAFSFWNTIFLGDSLTEEEKKNIISHELVHINHKHTIDQIGIETLKVLLWWNPLIYFYQARITLLHEYIADSVTISKVNQRNYIEQLLNAAFQTEKITFINQFFNQSLIKKRILMLQKSQSKSIAKFKYLLLIPVITGILTYTSCKKENNKPTLDQNERVKNDFESACINQNSQYNKNLDNYLKVTVGTNTDVIVDLVNIETSETIRTAYIPKTTMHFIRNIPEGKYRLDVVYGENYTEETIAEKCKGFFKNEKISENGENILDYHTVTTDQGKNVPSYALALDLVPPHEKEGHINSNDEKSLSSEERDAQRKEAIELAQKAIKEHQAKINSNDKKEQTPDEKRMEIAQKVVEAHRNKANTAMKSSSTNEISKKEAEPYCANQDPLRYDYKVDNYLKMTIGDNAEVIIDIVSTETSESIRTVHIPKNTEYFIRNIPEGIYNLKIVYGEGYQENLVNEKCTLSFDTKLAKEDGQDILDFRVIKTEQGINVPSYSMTLDMLDEHNHQ